MSQSHPTAPLLFSVVYRLRHYFSYSHIAYALKSPFITRSQGVTIRLFCNSRQGALISDRNSAAVTVGVLCLTYFAAVISRRSTLTASSPVGPAITPLPS